jgi:inner membrane protein
MMSVTHAAIAIATTSVALGSAESMILGAAFIGSQLPDLDKTDSFIGKVLFPIASFLEQRYAHRTITHSFLSSGVLAIATLPLLFWLHWHFWAALNIGHFMGWFSDCFTKAGVAAFYPSTVRLVIPGNPRARISSGSTWEYWVLAITAFLAVVSVNLASAGGITEQFARAFFQDINTASSIFQRYGGDRMIVANVQGMHSHTQQQIEQQFTIIEATKTDLIGEDPDSGKLYKIGSSLDAQIRPSRVKVELGDRISIKARETRLRDIAAEDWLKRLPQNAYVSGSLLLEDSDTLQIANSFENYDTIRSWGGQIEVRNAKPSQIAALIGEFWILDGRAIVKERTQ